MNRNETKWQLMQLERMVHIRTWKRKAGRHVEKRSGNKTAHREQIERQMDREEEEVWEQLNVFVFERNIMGF